MGPRDSPEVLTPSGDERIPPTSPQLRTCCQGAALLTQWSDMDVCGWGGWAGEDDNPVTAPSRALRAQQPDSGMFSACFKVAWFYFPASEWKVFRARHG